MLAFCVPTSLDCLHAELPNKLEAEFKSGNQASRLLTPSLAPGPLGGSLWGLIPLAFLAQSQHFPLGPPPPPLVDWMMQHVSKKSVVLWESPGRAQGPDQPGALTVGEAS